MKKKLLVALLMVVCIVASIWTTAAYYTREDKAENIVTMGDIQIGVTSTTVNEKGETVDFDGKVVGMPGKITPWYFSVTNEGSHDCYMRVEIEKVLKLKGGNTGKGDLLCFNINEKDWTYSDGYYYYNSIVKPGEETAPLFTESCLDPKTSSEYQNCKVTANLYVGATQSENNGENALDAGGWPER